MSPTPGPRSGFPLWAAALLGVAVLARGAFVLFRPAAKPEPAPVAPAPAVAVKAAEPAAPAISEKSLAVLPFSNMSEEKDSAFSGRLVLQYVETSFVNQRDELVARVLGWTTRHERKAARDKGKYKDIDIEASSYTPEQLDAIDRMALSEPERIRGDRTLYWEEVEVGQELPPIVRGPLSLMDTMGFLVGTGRGHTHGVLLQGAAKHPGHFFRNPEAGTAIEYTGIGHHRDSVAKQVGVPGTYDYGPQRTAWMCSLVSNWMGDAAFLKRLRADLRRFNMVGDTTWCRGRVSGKRVEDRRHLVDLEIWSDNQREEVTTKGVATVVLPARDTSSRVVLDGSNFELGLPVVR